MSDTEVCRRCGNLATYGCCSYLDSIVNNDGPRVVSADELLRVLHAGCFSRGDLDRAVAAEREAIVAWFLARRMTFTADEVLACIRARGGKP